MMRLNYLLVEELLNLPWMLGSLGWLLREIIVM